MGKDRKREEAADVKDAVKAGRLVRKKAAKVGKAQARILELAKKRYDRATYTILKGMHEEGLGIRDLLVLAQMEYLDVTADMDTGELGKGEGYRLRTQIIETLRKLAENETGGGAQLPNLIQINISEAGVNRTDDGGAALEMAS